MKKLIINKDNTIKDVYRDFGIYTKHVPFILYPKAKEPYKKSWYDEDGDDEYLPATPRYEAYTMNVDFVYEGALNTANTNIKNFLDFIQGGYFSLYDEYTGIGRQKIRYVSVDENATLYRRDKDVVEFTVSLKVNDPVTQITITLP